MLSRAIILADGHFRTGDGKTAQGPVHGRRPFRGAVRGRCRAAAGRTTAGLLVQASNAERISAETDTAGLARACESPACELSPPVAAALLDGLFARLEPVRRRAAGGCPRRAVL